MASFASANVKPRQDFWPLSATVSSNSSAMILLQQPGEAEEVEKPYGTHPHPCPESRATLPLGVLLVVLLMVLGWTFWGSADDVAETARSAGLFIQFSGMANYSIVILEAYELSKALHNTAAFSGQLIGIYMGTAALGSFVMSMILWKFPDVWKTHSRHVLLFSQLLNIVGFCVYCWVNSYVAFQAISSYNEARGLCTALLLSRIVSGTGHGISSQFLQVSFAHITSPGDRPEQMTRFVFTNTLGIGLGPLISAGLGLLDFCPAGEVSRFELVGQAQ